ncbi:DUF333 domain-containing protein [Candidatus Micrarchaeota archaeon]|nr:DUF333 domain-containing protein [Candidatus Micrarchaeota archaeon]
MKKALFVLLGIMLVSLGFAQEVIGMPNPSSVYCVGEGYTSRIITAEDGSQYGICVFTDGTFCGQWDYYNGECQPQPISSPTLEECTPNIEGVCSELYEPVCGSDEKTYYNSCFAENNCIKVISHGACLVSEVAEPEIIEEAPPELVVSTEQPELLVNLPLVSEVKPEIAEKVDTLVVKPAEVFSPVLSEITNLQIDLVVEEEKVVYKIALPEELSVYKEEGTTEPVLKLETIEQPVELKLVEQKIEIGNEQIIEYSNAMEKGELALVSTQAQSMDMIAYPFEIVAKPNAYELVFPLELEEQKFAVEVSKDLRIKENILSLVDEEGVYDIKVLPPQIYSAATKNEKAVLKNMALKVEELKAVYELKVEQPFNALWIIPSTAEVDYKISADTGEVEMVAPWWTVFGDSSALELSIE